MTASNVRILNLVRNSKASIRVSERTLMTAYLFVLLLSDALGISVALRIAYWIRFELKLSVAPDVIPAISFYQHLAVVMVLGCILLFIFAGLYHSPTLIGGTGEYSRAFNACSIGFLMVILATFTFQTFDVSRVYLAAAWFFSTIFVLVTRFSLRRIAYIYRERGHFRVRTAVIAVDGDSDTLIHELLDPRSGCEVVGLIGIGKDLSDFEQRDEQAPPPLGSLDELDDIVRQFGITEIVASSSSLRRQELLALYAKVHGIPGLELRLATGLFDLLTTGVQIRMAGVVPLISLNRMRLSVSELLIKTCVEYIVTIAGLLILMPFMALIALGIKIDSPGPVLHRRRVMGLRGQQFDAYKFRTMICDGDRILEKNPELLARLHADQKLKKDPRVTRFGAFLRKFSLDELPQLFNVLKGQMSLVGPRMISPPEAEKYGLNQFNLLTVKPGLTGLWQVSGRSDLSYEDRIRLDMYYIRNYTIWLDFHILFIRTANAVLRGHGAY